jgi:hypothetical protein
MLMEALAGCHNISPMTYLFWTGVALAQMLRFRRCNADGYCVGSDLRRSRNSVLRTLP